MGPDLLASLLAFNLGVILTLALRPVWQRGFGATATYALWLLPPLLSVAALLPQGGTQLEPVRLLARQVTTPLLAVSDVTANTEPGLLLWCWLAGALALGACIWIARVRLLGRINMDTAEFCPEHPELTIIRANFGPALIGLWRPRLVLPYDFESRYQPTQRTLVFAHEAAHQNSGDLWVRFLALALCVTQWWNPLSWWALLRLIDDQEAACDVRVLRSHPRSAALYAKTLIAASGPALPGTMMFCSLHPVHPLLRRIKMLKQAASTTASSRLASVMTLLVLIGASAATWAASDIRSTQPVDTGVATPDYYVALSAQIDEQPVREFSVAGLRDAMMGARIDDDDGTMELDLIVSKTATPGQVLLSMVVRRDGEEIGQPKIAMPLGTGGRIEIGERVPEGFRGFRLDATVQSWEERATLVPTAPLPIEGNGPHAAKAR